MEFPVLKIILSPETSSFVWIDERPCSHFTPFELAEIARVDNGLLMSYIRQQKLIYEDLNLLAVMMFAYFAFRATVYALTGEVRLDILSAMGLYFVMNGAGKVYENGTYKLINPWSKLEVLVMKELGVLILDDD